MRPSSGAWEDIKNRGQLAGVSERIEGVEGVCNPIGTTIPTNQRLNHHPEYTSGGPMAPAADVAEDGFVGH